MGEHYIQAAISSVALGAVAACGTRCRARGAEARRDGEEGKGKRVGLLFTPSQRIRRAACTWASNTRGGVGRSLLRLACSVR
jgi:hypothetical protein